MNNDDSTAVGISSMESKPMTSKSETSIDYSSNEIIKGNYTDRQKFLWVWYRVMHHEIYSHHIPYDMMDMKVLFNKLNSGV